jgi:inner membrane protein
MMILPPALTGALLLVARMKIGRWRHSPPAVRPGQLLLLSAAAVLSHPMLDTLNTYGVRWLMPFSGRWFYGDVLFIVDPWLWLMLGGSLVWAWSRRRRNQYQASVPVTWALTLALIYIGAMAIASIVARRVVAREIGQQFGGAVLAVMAGPLPLTPLWRSFVVEQADHYRVGSFHWTRQPQLDLTRVVTYPRRHPVQHPAYALADSVVAFRRFLGWARFPALAVQQTGPGEFLVHAVDLRYARAPGARFGTLTVPVTIRRASMGKTGRR